MEEPNISRLGSHVKEYVNENLNLLTLNIYDRASKALSSLVSAIVFWVLIIFAILFISLGLAWWIGTRVDNPFLGFIIMGGIYILITVILIANKDRWIRIPVINFFLKNITDEKDQLV
jgi:hypothetical protein